MIHGLATHRATRTGSAFAEAAGRARQLDVAWEMPDRSFRPLTSSSGEQRVRWAQLKETQGNAPVSYQCGECYMSTAWETYSMQCIMKLRSTPGVGDAMKDISREPSLMSRVIGHINLSRHSSNIHHTRSTQRSSYYLTFRDRTRVV